MAKKSKPQIWLEYVVARSILGFFGILPRKLSLFFSSLLAKTVYSLLGGLRRTARTNLEIAFPEKTSAEREIIAKSAFENLGRILTEISRFHKISVEELEQLVKIEFDEETQKIYDAEKAKGRGTIIVSPHIGNWEIAVFAYSAFREPLNYLARPLDNPLIEEMTVNLRTRFGNRPINKTSSVSTVLKILNDGGVLGVLPDVNTQTKEGVFVPFFGVPACTTSGVAMLAMRTNSMIVPICGIWDEENKCYKLINGKIIEPVKTGSRQEMITETTALYTAEIEKFIRTYPEQWLWIHKRWKTRPEGEKDLYSS